ncbi:hypothetical protein EON83_28120 [bacterium]|nr:MAG: hypothetical protein EON83_28120 [bacterium]
MIAVTYSTANFATASILDKVSILATIVMGETIIIAIVQYIGRRQQDTANSALLMERIDPTRVQIYEHLTQLPDFWLDQWCVLPSPMGSRALAVNIEHTRIALLDYQAPNGEPQITSKIFNRGDVASVTLEEALQPDTRTTWAKFIEGDPSIQLATCLLGSAGLPIEAPNLLGETQHQQEQAPPIANAFELQEHYINMLHLKVIPTDSQSPIEQLIFLRGRIDTLSEPYPFVRKNAEHWQTLFANLSSGGTGSTS